MHPEIGTETPPGSQGQAEHCVSELLTLGPRVPSLSYFAYLFIFAAFFFLTAADFLCFITVENGHYQHLYLFYEGG